MIRTDIDIKDIMWKLVSSSALGAEVSGRVYKDQRPLNSEVEDIVIAVVARDAGQTQEATVNVNVYVPDVFRGNEYIEDTPRLRMLCELAAELLEYNSSPGVLMRLRSQGVEKINGADWHCINNRVRLRFNNENVTQ